MSKQLKLSFARVPIDLSEEQDTSGNAFFFWIVCFEHCIYLFLGFSIPAREDDEVITDSYAVSALRTDSTDDDEGSTYLCQCQCCLDPYTPNQPKDLSTFGVSHTYQNKGKCMKTYLRHIQPNWYSKFPWISVCTTYFKIYCVTCRSAKYRNLLTYPKHSKSTFIDDGFQNLKKALERFREHEASVMHKEAIFKLAAMESSSGIGTLLSRQLESDQALHRTMLMKVLSCVKYLARQGLPLRGHYEDAESFQGNLYQLLLLHANESPDLKRWLQQREYISPEIINEIITGMGQYILRQLLWDIKNSLCFSILADEATDISHHEQMSISIRWVDCSYNIHEDILGLIRLPDTKALTIFSAIKDVLIRCSLPLAQCRGQAYDGAANMSGTKRGVQALVKSEVNKALYVHCLAHNLNLCLKDVTSTCDMIRDVLDFIYNLVQLIRFSPKRLSLFDSLRKDIGLQNGETNPSLRILCPTRWTIRHKSIYAILKNYTVLQDALEVIKVGRDEYAARANGLLACMEKFDTFFALKLAYLLFSSAEQLSINLQSVDITVQEALNGAKLLATHLNSLRKDSSFDTFYDGVYQESKNLTDEPTLPRRKTIPQRFNEGGQAHQYESPKARYRHAYFEVLELAAGEVGRRFDHEDLYLIKEIEILLLKAGNGEDLAFSSSIQSYLENDIDLEQLKHQLSLVHNMIKTANFNGASVTKVTNIRTIAHAMNTSDIYKKMLNEVDKLIKLYFTFPVTTASVERSFSSLRRMKTFLRSTMTECRLNNLFLIYIHKSLTDEMDLLKIAKNFVSVNSRRLNYFGKFS